MGDHYKCLNKGCKTQPFSYSVNGGLVKECFLTLVQH